MSLNGQVADYVRKVAAEWPAEPETNIINAALRVLSRWRQYRVQEAYLHRHGTVIWGGIFKGMDYVSTATEGALL
ncbi:MAG: SAM-dependent methyltransferase, partial [Frankiales bacterium]|nr:SAM-dependent methyltransferase [Frankiales bacterium]